MPLDPPEDEPTSEDLDLYYGLSHKRAADDCNIASLTAGWIGALVGGAVAFLVLPYFAIFGALLGWFIGASILIGFTSFIRYFSGHKD
jgi:uncharacterized membrane protein YeaQ/YmgE (transglycosylase-associated protein family)